MNADAVIFIPGIKGTKLVETNRASWDTIWSGIQYNFETLDDLNLTAQYQGKFFEENERSIIRPGEIEALAYGEFLNDLKTDKPVYIFNYDWRLSAQENGKRLGEFLDYLTEKSRAMAGQSPYKRFDFITHSLGNAVLRNLIHREKMARINKIVFTVPPFSGSLDILVTALIGEGFFKGVKAKIRKLIRTMPGALELLPSYSKASYYHPSAKHDLFKFSSWQSNVRDQVSETSEKMKKVLKLAKNTVDNELCDLSTLSKSERERMLILVRSGFETWQSVPVQKNVDGVENFVEFAKGLRTDDGDGRVPHISSCLYHADIQTLVLDCAFWFRDYDHGLFLKDERAQKIINRFLFSEQPFKYQIPGGAIQRVNSLTMKLDDYKRPYWQINS